MEVRNLMPAIPLYCPLWHSLMCMKAFCEGDRESAELYYDMGQEILSITGSVYIPLSQSGYVNMLRHLLRLPEKTGLRNPPAPDMWYWDKTPSNTLNNRWDVLTKEYYESDMIHPYRHFEPSTFT